ncbi:MAG: hypothetical protein IPH35_18070 [Rhodoferax sp.]|nr:hypothetical protein [Rhodoferax sp.]
MHREHNLNAQTTYSGKLADKPIFTDFAEASKEDQALVEKLNAGRIGTDGTGKAVSPNTQSEGTLRADRIAARMGKRVVWVTGLAGDGFSDPAISRDAIFLNPDSQRSVQVLVAHELTHNLAAQYPEQFRGLIDAIRPNLNPEEWAGFVERQQKDSLAATGKLLSPATLRSEMVANLLSDYAYRSHADAAGAEFSARGGNFTGYGGYLREGTQAKVDIKEALYHEGAHFGTLTDRTGLPKGQLTLSGGSEGRKLNAQTERGRKIPSGTLGDPIFTDRVAGSKEDQALVEKLIERGLAGSGSRAVAPVNPGAAALRAARVAARFDKRVVWVEGLTESGLTFRGLDAGVIFLNPDSGRSAQVLTAHELAHQMAGENQQAFARLAQALSKLVSQEVREAFRKRHDPDGKMSPGSLWQEMAGNLVADWAYRAMSDDVRAEDAALGERQVAQMLTDNGYHEVQPGVWKPEKASLSGGSEGRKLNAQTGEPEDGRARLITRLADDRRSEFANVGKKGVAAGKVGADSFGAFGKDITYFFYDDGDFAHTFIIPDQFIPRLKAALNQISADKKANALQFFAVQHGMYHKANGTFDTFGPRREYPGGKLAESMGVLSDANGTTQAGEQLTRIDGTTDRQVARFLATSLAYAKHVLGKDQIPVNWERITGANKSKTGSGIFNAQEQAGPSRVVTQAEMDQAQAEADKLFGKGGVNLEFRKITGYSGEYISATDTIVIATTAAAGTMNTLYHEAMHLQTIIRMPQTAGFTSPLN